MKKKENKCLGKKIEKKDVLIASYKSRKNQRILIIFTQFQDIIKIVSNINKKANPRFTLLLFEFIFAKNTCTLSKKH